MSKATPAVPVHRVVLIDDEPMIVRLLRVGIEGRPGLTVVGEAFDGQEGVDLLERVEADAVILDVQMPRLDGWTAARLLRQRQPSLVICMYTGAPPPPSGDVAADAVHAKSAGPGPLLDDLEARLARRAEG
jgi:chemotaxis response regulator CheB